MSLLDTDSCDCARSELELFEIPPTQTSIEESRYEQFYPLTSLDRNTPIEFKIVAAQDEYLDLFQSQLYLKARIVDSSGAALPRARTGNPPALADKTLVFPVNYFPASYFSRVECYINSKPVGNSENLYPYRSYMENTLAYMQDVKQTSLHASMFHPDVSDFEEFSNEELTEDTRNKGAKKRWDRTKFSEPFEMISPIHNSLFQQQKLILSKVPIYLKFHRNNLDFVLMSKLENHPHKIIIDTAILIVNVKKIAPHVRAAHEEKLLSSNAKYPLRKVEMKFFTRAAGRADLSEQNLVNGVLPKRVIMGMVSTEAFNGSKHKNPYNFQDFGISSLVLRKNGIATPFDKMDFNFENDEYMMGYFSLLQSVGLWGHDSKNNGITPTRDYKNGYTLFGFNLSPDESLGDNLNLIKEGHLSFDLRLRAGHAESITIICYLEFDTILEIDSDRNILYNE